MSKTRNTGLFIVVFFYIMVSIKVLKEISFVEMIKYCK